MRSFILVVLMLFSVGVYAGSITTEDLGDFNSLTPAQKAEVVATIAKKTEQNAADKLAATALPTTPEDMQRWVGVGAAIGKGMAEAAKELGVAADEFAKSTVGMIAIALLVWHILGADLVQLLVGGLWLCFWIPFCVWMIKRTMMQLVNVPIKKGDTTQDRYVWKLRDTPDNLSGTFFLSFAYTAIGVAFGWFTILA